jgi:flavin-dependent dehydrogenase
MKETETGIIGGGLAGLSLAILLARQGRMVTLWEKGSYPAHRVCGEYISRESLPFLMRLLPDFDWHSLPLIDQLLISSPSGKILREKLDMGGIGISRYRLDAALAEEALRSGVNLLENMAVKNFFQRNGSFEVETADQSWNCKTLFLAWGKGRGPGEAARNPKSGKHYIGVKYHIRFPHPPEEIQLHNFRNGYCGMSRVEEGISCLCYLADAAELQACGNDLRAMEEKVLMRNPFLKEIFAEAEFLWKAPKVISGIRFGEWGSSMGNALLLGDAAGCIAPLCGNGMSLALHAASQLGEFLQNSDNLPEEYREFRNRKFRRRIEAGSLIQHFFGGEFLSNAAIEILNLSPALFRKAIVKKTHGLPF